MASFYEHGDHGEDGEGQQDIVENELNFEEPTASVGTSTSKTHVGHSTRSVLSILLLESYLLLDVDNTVPNATLFVAFQQMH